MLKIRKKKGNYDYCSNACCSNACVSTKRSGKKKIITDIKNISFNDVYGICGSTISSYTGDLTMSAVAKRFILNSQFAMAEESKNILNSTGKELRGLIQLRSFTHPFMPREYNRLFKQSFQDQLTLRERRPLGIARTPLFDGITRVQMQVEQLVKYDESLKTLANKLRRQLPTLPQDEVEEIRAWLENPDNQDLVEGITEVDLSACELKVIPPEIAYFTNLEIIDLSYNNIKEIPSQIGALVNLIKLDLLDNEIDTITPEIENLQLLEELALGNNKLTSIPVEIFQLESLKQLYLWKNQISELPSTIANLQDLEWLDLADNQLQLIPNEVTNLSALQHLDLGDNQLSFFPVVALLSQGLPNIANIQLERNEFSDFYKNLFAMAQTHRLIEITY